MPFSKSDTEGIISYAVYAMRDTLAEESIRNNFLENIHIKELGTQKGVNVIFEKTLAQASVKKINSFLKSLIKKTKQNDIVLFTISNRPDPGGEETHFQTFILLANMNTIIAFDPARKKAPGMSAHMEKEKAEKYWGIYGDYAIDDVVKFVKNFNLTSPIKLNVEYAPVSQTCQIDESEVFCQSWSLYLQYQFLYNLLSTGKPKAVPIPKTQEQKYKLLAEFFRLIIKLEKTQKVLKEMYISAIQTQLEPKSWETVDPVSIIINITGPQLE